jgi:hypothetical protein
MFSGGTPIQIIRMRGLRYLDHACNNFTGNTPLPLGNLKAMAHTPNNNSALFSITNAVKTDSLLVVHKGHQQIEFNLHVELLTW